MLLYFTYYKHTFPKRMKYTIFMPTALRNDIKDKIVHKSSHILAIIRPYLTNFHKNDNLIIDIIAVMRAGCHYSSTYNCFPSMGASHVINESLVCNNTSLVHICILSYNI